MSEKILVVRITFKSMPELIVENEEYQKYGNLLKFCSEYSIDLKDVHRCKRELIDIREFPTRAWEG